MDKGTYLRQSLDRLKLFPVIIMLDLVFCLFVCLFGGVSKAGDIRTLLKTSLPVAVLRVAKGRIP
jgi:hypothetical protein